MILFAQLEDKIVARFKAAMAANALGYVIAEVASYNGQLDDPDFAKNFRRFPAVWVTVGGDKPVRQLSSASTEMQITAAVMVATRNIRGERETRHGDVNEPGVYQLVEDTRNLLARQKFGLPITQLLPGASRTLYKSSTGQQALGVYAVEFTCRYTYTPPSDDSEDTELTGVRMRFYLKPGDDEPDVEAEIPPP